MTLYTRRGCHLCEVALETLQRHGLHVDTVDIDSDTAPQTQYGRCIPVVCIDGKERFRGRVDERLLRRLLAGRDRR